MQLKALENQKYKVDIELEHLSENSDEYINKLEKKKELIYKQQEIIQKMENISGNLINRNLNKYLKTIILNIF